MKGPTYANEKDIKQWGKSKRAETQLPDLLRRLAHATLPDPQKMDFPAGEEVEKKGWDGLVVAEVGNEFIPKGASGWEVSKSKNIESTADTNYDKRSDEPDPLDPDKAAFIFVTPRRWNGKRDWDKEKNDENTWNQVKALDASDLHQWMNQPNAKSAHVWFSQIVGNRPRGVQDLAKFWKDWSQITDPQTPHKLLLSGRESTVEIIHSWFGSDKNHLTIKADTKKEAIAVFIAAIKELPKSEIHRIISNSIIVDNKHAWDNTVYTGENLILIPKYDVGDEISSAFRNGNEVFIPIGRDGEGGSDTHDLPNLSIDGVIEILKEEGFESKNATELARQARRSMSSFRKKLCPIDGINQPDWSNSDRIRDLLEITLVGSFDSNKEGDREIIDNLGDESYEDTIGKLSKLKNVENPPVRKTGSIWYIRSKEEVWHYLSDQLSEEDFRRFRNCAVEVLTEVDPKFDLPDEDQWKAQTLGKSPRYSNYLKEGLADTLAMINFFGSETKQNKRTSNEFVNSAIHKIFEIANGNWKCWASLSENLPLIAEASPEIFVNKIQNEIDKSEPEINELFRDQDSSIVGSSSPHTGLLWALENLAWCEDYLAQTSLTLAKLEKLDPGGNLSNRPLRSLTEIYLLWHPQTNSSLDERINILEMLKDETPKVTWSLLKNLIPNQRSTAMGTHKPKWRKWDDDVENQVNKEEFYRGATEIISLMLNMVEESGERWKDIIDNLHRFSPEERDKAINQLQNINIDDLSIDARYSIWNALKDFLSNQRSFPEADWSLPEDELEPFGKLISKFEPENLIDRFAWLFSHNPSLPEGLFSKREKRKKKIEKRRLKAIEKILDEAEWKTIFELAEEVEDVYGLGNILGKNNYLENIEDQFLVENLASDKDYISKLSEGFVAGRANSRGRSWVKAKLEENKTLTPSQKSVLFLHLPFEADTWNRIQEEGAEVEKAYWKIVRPFNVEPKMNLEFIIEKLLSVERPYEAMKFCHRCISENENVNPDLMIQVIKEVSKTEPPDSSTRLHFSHYLPELLNTLNAEEIDNEQVAEIEWAFLEILIPNNYVPKALHKKLGSNPHFFCKLLDLIYTNNDERDPDEVTKEEEKKAELAWKLLNSWRSLPGQYQKGEIDKDYLIDWVEETRKILKDMNLLEVGDIYIGKVLSGCPVSNDEIWPHESVRNVVETVCSSDLEQGIENGKFNSRGVVTKNVYEGGEQELKLAEKFESQAKNISSKWPRTASMLRRMAEKYRSYAEQEDIRADVREDLGK